MSAKNKQIQLRSKFRHKLVATIFVALFAGIGSYLLLQTQAETRYTSQYEDGTGEVTTWITGDQATPEVGSPVTSSFSIGIRNTSTRTKYVNIGVDIPGSKSTTGGTVTVSGVTWNTSVVDVYGATQAGKGCFPISGSTRNITLASYTVSATASGGTDIQSYAGGRITIEYFTSCGGSSLGQSNKHVNSYWGPGVGGGGCVGDCGGSPSPDPDPSPDPSPNPGPGPAGPGPIGDDGTNAGTRGHGSGKTGTGTGGGSSGSTATKQGNKPNSTPSSSSQGNKNQTKLDPSPFYDGKQYNRGSESDSSFGGLFNKPTNGGIARGWYFLTALILLATGAGYWWWRTKRKV